MSNSSEKKMVVNDALERALSNANMQLPAEHALSMNDTQLLSCDEGGLDSLGILILLTSIEESFQQQIGLIDMLMMGSNSEVFETVGALRNYLLERV